MSSILEVVFERVTKSCVIQLLSLLIKNVEEISSIQCSEKVELFVNDGLSKEAIDQFLRFDGEIIALFNLKAMKLRDIVLPNVQLRLVKYENEYDIDFNFDCNEIENTSTAVLIDELHAQAKDFACKFDIASFYGGMEPASDEDTRYFTNDVLGPLTGKE